LRNRLSGWALAGLWFDETRGQVTGCEFPYGLWDRACYFSSKPAAEYTNGAFRDLE
jgi:hypothetical protein